MTAGPRWAHEADRIAQCWWSARAVGHEQAVDPTGRTEKSRGDGLLVVAGRGRVDLPSRKLRSCRAIVRLPTYACTLPWPQRPWAAPLRPFGVAIYSHAKPPAAWSPATRPTTVVESHRPHESDTSAPLLDRVAESHHGPVARVRWWRPWTAVQLRGARAFRRPGEPQARAVPFGKARELSRPSASAGRGNPGRAACGPSPTCWTTRA